jgi:hypothetical protein
MLAAPYLPFSETGLLGTYLTFRAPAGKAEEPQPVPISRAFKRTARFDEIQESLVTEYSSKTRGLMIYRFDPTKDAAAEFVAHHPRRPFSP